MAHQCFSLVAMVMVVVLCVLFVESRPAIDGGQNLPPICRLPAARGHCRALIPRWMYNPATGNCEEFGFGGCDGNANNFMSYKACMATCGGLS